MLKQEVKRGKKYYTHGGGLLVLVTRISIVFDDLNLKEIERVTFEFLDNCTEEKNGMKESLSMKDFCNMFVPYGNQSYLKHKKKLQI